jgi:hypothetical protein
MKAKCVGRVLVAAASCRWSKVVSLRTAARCDLEDIFHAVDDLLVWRTFSTPWTICWSGGHFPRRGQSAGPGDIVHAVDDLTGETTFSTPWTTCSAG